MNGAREAVNRDDLDGWFARADDVLTDWHGSDDAMDSTNPDLIPERVRHG